REKVRDLALINASKAYSAQMAIDVALTAIQCHGGYGYMEEYHLEKLARDAKLLELGAGTTDINLLTAARHDLGLVECQRYPNGSASPSIFSTRASPRGAAGAPRSSTRTRRSATPRCRRRRTGSRTCCATPASAWRTASSSPCRTAR